MKVLSREEIKERRKYFLANANKKTVINKGDKRVHGSRVCALCGSSLSTVTLSDGRSIATKNHYHCDFSELFYVDLCKDIRSCYSVMNKLGGGDS